jgi:hypothetical protein
VTVTLAGAILLQITGLALLRHRLGRAWLRRPVTWLFLACVVYQGASAVLIMFPSVAAQDTFRTGVDASFIDDGALIQSAGMLCLAVAYLMTQPQRAAPVAAEHVTIASSLDWRLLSVACAPLAVLTYEGRGYNGLYGIGSGASLATDLAATSFTILIAVTAFAVILRAGPRWFLVVLIAQSLLLAAAGERLPVLADVVALTLMLAHAGIRPPRRQMRAAAVLAVIAVLAVTGARASSGRSLYETGTGLQARATALGNGVVSFNSGPAGSPGLVAQAATRLDGDAFAGAVLQAEALGHPRMSAAYVAESVLVVVPSALWPAKLSQGNDLNPGIAEIDDLGLQPTNFLDTLPGLYMGLLPWPLLLALMAGLGLLCGWGERWLLQMVTPVRLVLLAGAVTAVFAYEKGLPGMLVALRSALLIAVAVKLIMLARVRRADRRQRGLPSAWALEPTPHSQAR